MPVERLTIFMEEAVKRVQIATLFAIACLTTASAQQATVTPEQRRELEEISQRTSEAWNKLDAKALASRYAVTATRIDSGGSTHGQLEIEGRYQELIKGGLKKLSLTQVSVEPIEGGKAILAVYHYTATLAEQPIQGNTLVVYESEGTGLKIRASASSRILK